MKNSFFIAILLLSFLNLNAKDKILVGCTLVNPPLETKYNRGILTEFINEVFKELKQKVEIKIYPWTRCQEKVKDGSINFLFNVGKNNERLSYAYFTEEILFTEEYFIFGSVLSRKKFDENFKNLKNVTIAVQRGYRYGGEIQLALDKKKFKKVYEVETITQMIKLVNSKRIDFFIGDQIPSLYYINKSKLHGSIINYTKASNCPTYVAFSKEKTDPDFVKKVSDQIKKLKKQGVYDRLVRKYLNNKKN